MKTRMFASVIASGLAVLLGAGMAAGVVQAGPVSGRYPAAVGTSHEHLNAASLPHGYLGWDSTYVTQDELTTVWHWYARQFAVEPEEGTHSGEPCMKLASVQTFGNFGRTLGVTLCAARQGSRVAVSQTFYWRPVR